MRWLLSVFLTLVNVLSFSQIRTNPLPEKSRVMFGASFIAPDTVCVNEQFTIHNTTESASTYYWNFCVANSSTNPTGLNLGNFGFSTPVFTDYAKDGINYYVFVTNNYPGKLVRLDFGASLLNTPTARDFGNLGGIIPDFCEGVQLVKNEGHWYALILGGKPVGKIVKVDFGATLANNNPAATDWGNIGDLAYPTDLHVFQNGDQWFGLTINALNNSITRFNFTSSFSNTPTAVNYGNIGGLNYPTGIYAVKKDDTWYAFVSNAGDGGANSSNSSLTRLDFGNSLLNQPTGINLGNPGNTLRSSRDITIYQSCNEIFGYVVNYSWQNDIVRLNFNNSLTSVPSAISIGNSGNLNFPHSISKLFRVENDLYSFVTNVNNNTITRLKFDGCNGTSIPSSTQQNPDPVRYSQAGVYNINLITDDGLPTQNSFCKQVVVVPSLHTPLQSKRICNNDSVLLTSSNISGNLWNTGSTDPFINVNKSGIYWVKSTNAGGCTNVDSFNVEVISTPLIKLGQDTSICSADSLLLNAGNNGASFLWQTGQASQTIWVKQAGSYNVTVSNNGCSASDTIVVNILPLPQITIAGNKAICEGNTTQISASGGVDYIWTPSYGLSNPLGAVTSANPKSTTTYLLSSKGQNGCTAKDSVTLEVTPRPIFTAAAKNPVLCLGDTTMLIASGGDVYEWTPSTTLDHPDQNKTLAFPTSNTIYKVVITNNRCTITDSIFITLPVVSKPSVATTKTNDINCFIGEAILHTSGGSQYLWIPAKGLSDPSSPNPLVRINETTTYHLFVTTKDGCLVEDSITVNVMKSDDGSGFPVPSAFTPNGDGKNDCFGVKSWGDVSQFSLNIFNRWGELLFHSDDPTKCWNGLFKGQQQPGDVYVYWIKAKTRCGDVFRKGTFTLIR